MGQASGASEPNQGPGSVGSAPPGVEMPKIAARASPPALVQLLGGEREAQAEDRFLTRAGARTSIGRRPPSGGERSAAATRTGSALARRGLRWPRHGAWVRGVGVGRPPFDGRAQIPRRGAAPARIRQARSRDRGARVVLVPGAGIDGATVCVGPGSRVAPADLVREPVAGDDVERVRDLISPPGDAGRVDSFASRARSVAGPRPPASSRSTATAPR